MSEFQVIFLDETGFAPDWQSSIEDRPFYVLSAVMIPAMAIPDLYADARAKVSGIGIRGHTSPLGLGFEIKAKEVAQGSGWWQKHPEQRAAIRDLMLSLPQAHGGQALIVVLSKNHKSGTGHGRLRGVLFGCGQLCPTTRRDRSRRDPPGDRGGTRPFAYGAESSGLRGLGLARAEGFAA